ncbi:MAG: DedA family protein [Anaerolineae bacterium]|nr:DedA family protein [Anaerolineae bacterium]
MADLINQITIFLEHLLTVFGYPGMFVVQVLENVFTPIPSEPLLPLAGMMASQGKINLLAIWAVAVAGSTTGSLILYLVGKRGGEPAVRALIRRWGKYTGMNEGMLDYTLKLFKQYGGWMVFFGRFLPVVRPTMSIVSGMSKLPLKIFIPCTALSTGFAIALYMGLGYILGENWRSILDIIRQYEPLIIVGAIIVGTVVVSYMIWKVLKIREVRRSAEVND